MGAAFPTCKPQSSIERLDRVVQDIRHLEVGYQRLEHRKQTWMESLVTYGTGFYVVVVGLLYLYHFPEDRSTKRIYTAGMALYPVFLVAVKEALGWWFKSRMEKTADKLGQLREEKRQVLDSIMDMEPFKSFRNCLEKSEENVDAFSTLMDNSAFDKKLVLDDCKTIPTVTFPTFIDRVLEYIAGDGKSNRFALICAHCKTHNGMALREEYDYIGYKCSCCRYYNPAKKVRPNAPKLVSGKPGAYELGESDIENSSEDDKSSKSNPNSRNRIYQGNPQADLYKIR